MAEIEKLMETVGTEVDKLMKTIGKAIKTLLKEVQIVEEEEEDWENPKEEEW